MVKQLVQVPKVGKTQKGERQSPNSRKYSQAHARLNPNFVDLPSRIASGRGGISALGTNRLEWWDTLREAS